MTILFSIMGLSAGFMIAGGVFTTLIVVGLIPRFSEKTHTANHILLYEDMIIWGVIFGTFFTVYKFYFSHNLEIITRPFLAVYGLFSGIFVGCLAIAIAEMLDTIPIFTRRINFKQNTAFIILGMALGKLLGSLFYFIYLQI